MAKEYTDLSNFKITFNPLTYRGKRWRQVFEDEYARVIFVGYKIRCIIDTDGLDELMKDSMLISDEIKKGKVKLERDSLKKRLHLMYRKVNDISGGNAELDIPDQFVDYLLPYLKKEKNFGYKIIQE